MKKRKHKVPCRINFLIRFHSSRFKAIITTFVTDDWFSFHCHNVNLCCHREEKCEKEENFTPDIHLASHQRSTALIRCRLICSIKNPIKSISIPENNNIYQSLHIISLIFKPPHTMISQSHTLLRPYEIVLLSFTVIKD